MNALIDAVDIFRFYASPRCSYVKQPTIISQASLRTIPTTGFISTALDVCLAFKSAVCLISNTTAHPSDELESSD
jgi:hypothetical protein